MSEIETIDKSFKINYIPHKTRFKEELLEIFLISALFSGIIFYQLLSNQFYLASLILFVGVAVLLSLYSYIKYLHSPMPFINEIRIENNQIIISGYNFDTVWHEHLDIHETKLKIVGGGSGGTNIDYFLLFTSNKKSFRINHNKKWNYSDIYEIFILFYKIKNEIPRLEDRLMIDYIEKKAHGISTFDMIWRHKEIKR